jgi:integrase
LRSGIADFNPINPWRHRLRAQAASDVTATRQDFRDAVLRDAGSLTYDHIQGEFQRLARQLKWPREATPKDLRHLFATTMNNAHIPEAYRRYLMGQSPGKAAIVAYTHLNELRRHYAEAVHREWLPLIEKINHRICEVRT